jgi:hypothetical protein
MIAPGSSTHDFPGSASPTTIANDYRQQIHSFMVSHQGIEIEISIVDFLVEIMKYATMAAFL